MPHDGLLPSQKNVLKEILSPYAQKIRQVGLFGSRATGKYRENSDIDMVIYGSLTPAEMDRLWTLFDASSLAIKVDVVAYDLITYLPLKAHIDAMMQPLFSPEDFCKDKEKE